VKIKTKKATVAAVAAGLVMSLVTVFAGLCAVNTLLDSEKTETIAVTEPVQKLVVAADAGDVKVVATDADRVTVKRTTHWVTSEPKPTKTVSGGVLRLADDCDGWTTFRCETSYRVEVPRGLAVDVKADSGDVDVRGVTGAVDLSSDSGDVSGHGLTGARLRAASDSGDVRLGLVSAPSSVEALSDSGDVDVELPRGEYALDTHTDSGDTSVHGIVRYDRADHAVKARSDSGDVTVEAQ
jgi:putative adhesin